ncbi:MAG: hypothetical protein SFX19_07105 [Alphaproteobacteria bacterium]|nr:hypothetical protein [Alphaproteobacteria bacterium]
MAKAAPTFNAQRDAITAAVGVFFEEKGIDPTALSFHFSANIGEHDGSAASIDALGGYKGFKVTPSDTAAIPQDYAAISGLMQELAADNGAHSFKTYKVHRTMAGAMTWEDLAQGLNDQFARLGSSAKVDLSAFKAK